MLLDFQQYVRVIVMASGGKDSTAVLLYLLALGVHPSKIWIWHQCVDGHDETAVPFFDWESTPGYVTALAAHLNLSYAFQWREYGFHGELFKRDSRSHSVRAAFSGKTVYLPTTPRSKPATRRRWPAKRGSLRERWCTSCLKIDVGRRVLNHVKKWFPAGSKFLVCTGERREESPNRAKLQNVERHACSSQSYEIHHWRPVLEWKERKVWDLYEKNSLFPHPAYYLGFPRLSCRSCIFYSKDHWATLDDVAPQVTKALVEIERDLDFTIDNKLSLPELISQGKTLCRPENRQYIQMALSAFSPTQSLVMEDWTLPAGAFGVGGGSV